MTTYNTNGQPMKNDLLEQFAKELSEGLLCRAKASQSFNMRTAESLIPVAKTLATRVDDKESLLLVGLLLAQHLIWVESALERVRDEVSDAALKLS